MERTHTELGPNTPLHPDQLVGEIFRLQNELDPDGDPGDMLIDIQDDSALVIVAQHGKDGYFAGPSIQEALEAVLASVKSQHKSMVESAVQPKEGIALDPATGRAVVYSEGVIIGEQG